MNFLYCVEELLRYGPRDALMEMAQWTDGVEITIAKDDPRFAKFIGENKIVPQSCPERQAERSRLAEEAKQKVGDDSPGVDFADTYICKSQRNCELCRDPEGGREWRRGMRTVHPTPGNLADFKCPYGKPWGYEFPSTGPGKLGTIAEAITIEHNQGLGDAVMLTAAIRDLHKTHPGRFTVHMRSERRDVFAHNPYIRGKPGGRSVRVECWPDEYRDDGPHFLYHFHRKLSASLGVKINEGKLGGDIYLSREEVEAPPPIAGPYWLLFAGSSPDFSTKRWGGWQELVDRVGAGAGKINLVRVGQPGYWRAPVTAGVTDLYGKTSIRELIKLVYHADGVVSPISAGMHLAAAVPTPPGHPQTRPCIVLAGGREQVNFIQYPGHTVLHTIGQLPCCASRACWKYRVGDDCQHLSANPEIAKCMGMLAPATVAEAMLRYQAVADDHREQWNAKPEAERLRGLGDVIARITGAFGIRKCSSCTKRQETLNRMVPFK